MDPDSGQFLPPSDINIAIFVHFDHPLAEMRIIERNESFHLCHNGHNFLE